MKNKSKLQVIFPKLIILVLLCSLIVI